MFNQCAEFKTLLKMLPLYEQIDEINNRIVEFNSIKNPNFLIDNRYERIKELKQIRISLKIKMLNDLLLFFSMLRIIMYKIQWIINAQN